MKFNFKNSKVGSYLSLHPRLKNFIKNSLITLLVIGLTIPLQYALGEVENVKDENIFLILIVAVLIILVQTKNIFYGIFASFIFVLSFNLLNASPIGSLEITDGNYYLSFVIFIVVCLIVGTLVMDLQNRNKVAIESNKKIKSMYELSSKLLDNHDKAYIYKTVVNFFNDNYGKYVFSIVDVEGNIYGDVVLSEELKQMMKFSLEKNVSVGKNTFTYKTSEYVIFPVRSSEKYYASLVAYVGKEDVNHDQLDFVKQNIFHLVVALDRESAIKEKQNAKIIAEKEKLQNQLLRGLSHDLKTPLTSIKSGSDLLLSSYDKIDDETKKQIVQDIYNDSCGLNEFIENLLNMTKLNQDKSLVKRKVEPVDDILIDIRAKFKKSLGTKTLNIETSDELIFVYADAILLEQVFANLVSNAIKHTKEGSTITIKYYKENDGVTFEVVDNGGGIKEKDIDKIFEDFFTLSQKQDHQRGTGLGLSISRAIIEAHDGHIEAFNNDIGGATFKFNIPDQIKE